MNEALSQTEGIARAAFAEIAARFPRLEIIEEAGVPVEISLRVPAQEGLKHSVWLAFQNDDELHFAVGHFWFEWFPCTDQGKVRSFVDAVTGFLSGSYRSLEHYRGTDCFKAKLQRRTGNDWETIATWSKIRWPSFRRVTYKEITNVQQMSQIEPDL